MDAKAFGGRANLISSFVVLFQVWLEENKQKTFHVESEVQSILEKKIAMEIFTSSHLSTRLAERDTCVANTSLHC